MDVINPRTGPLCDSCRLPLQMFPQKLTLELTNLRIDMCPVCASVHAPMLNAISRKLTPQKVGLE